MRAVKVSIKGRTLNDHEISFLINSCESKEMKEAIKLGSFKGYNLSKIIKEIKPSLQRRSLQKNLKILGREFLSIDVTFSMLRHSWVINSFYKGYNSEWICLNGGFSDIYLCNYKRKKIGYIGAEKRYKVLKRDNFVCKLCGSNKNLEVDHIIPITKEGNNNLTNLQTLCRKCNIGKSNNN